MAMLLGWSPRDGREKFQAEEKVGEFELGQLRKAGSTFHWKKFRWLAGQHMRDLEGDHLLEMAMPFVRKSRFAGQAAHIPRSTLVSMIEVVRPRVSNLSEIPQELAVFFEEPELDPEVRDRFSGGEGAAVIRDFKARLRRSESLTQEGFLAMVKEIGEARGIGGKKLYIPLRVALTGKAHGPDLHRIAPLLGRDVCIRRAEKAIQEGWLA
jgi:glutamyl/glutaminyl-tRNA synthetase